MKTKPCQQDSSWRNGQAKAKAARPRVAVLFYRLGPYHFARLKAASACLDVTAVEFSNVDTTYAWDEVRGQDRFEWRMLFSGASVAAQPTARIFQTVDATLDRLRPDAVAIPGWYDRCSLAALRWCVRRRVPAVLMSETTAWDDTRRPWRELVKRRVVRFCGAGLVGGRSHAEYLEQLGMPRDRIFVGYDVVDNEYFAAGAAKWQKLKAEIRNQKSEDGESGKREAESRKQPGEVGDPVEYESDPTGRARLHGPGKAGEGLQDYETTGPQDREFVVRVKLQSSNAASSSPGKTAERPRGEQGSEVRSRYGLPDKYFLASARFIEKKNLPRLVQAFARYRALALRSESGERRSASTSPRPSPQGGEGDAPWDLVLLGDGPLKSDLCRLISDLGLQHSVLLPGFKQYDELPVYYGLASAFVHASTTEQWGLVVNEAMASGLPVLVSNRCGCASDLVQEGRNGFTFDPSDTEQLARLMYRLSAPDTDLAGMGSVSRELARGWGTSAFGEGLSQAVATALEMAPVKATLLDRVFLESLVHGVRVLPPIDERATAKPAEKKRSDGEPEYLVFSFRGRKVLAVPSQPRKIRRVAISRYQPYTPKRQLYSGVLKTAVLLRCERLIASAGPVPQDAELGFTSPGWLKSLLEDVRLRLDCSWEHAILAWPSQPSRGRLYVHLLTQDLAPLAFVKIAPQSADDTSLKNGLETLQQLAQLPLKWVRLPRVLGSGQFASVMYTVLESLPVGARPARFPRNHDPSAILAEFSRPTRRLTGEAITSLSWWNAYTKKLQARHQAFHTALLELLPLGAEVFRVHGDLGLSNMVLAGDKLWLFDWENSHPSGPAMTDRVGYFLSFSVGKTARQPERCLRDFRRRFSSGTSPQQRLDLMLALAFRFGSGIPDADFYICNWPTLLPAASG